MSKHNYSYYLLAFKFVSSIFQALTILYRKDADRIDTMQQEYENQLLEDDVFSENIAPAPEGILAV